MTNEIQQTRYDRIIRRVAGIIGPGSKVSEVITELFPVLDVERVPSELLLLGGTRVCVGEDQQTSGAATSPRVQLFNPVDSGILITVTQVIYTASLAGNVRMGSTETLLAASVGTELFRDRRLTLGSRPAGQVFADSTLTQAPADWLFKSVANESLFIKDANDIAILPPGSGLEIGSGLQNLTIQVTFLWRERPAEQSELSI